LQSLYRYGAVPAFPYGTYLVGRLRAPRRDGDGAAELVQETGVDVDDVAGAGAGSGRSSLSSPASSWSEEKAAAHGPVVATVVGLCTLNQVDP
jgi:hypothetical protein